MRFIFSALLQFLRRGFIILILFFSVGQSNAQCGRYIYQTPKRKMVNTIIFTSTMLLTVATMPISFIPVIPMVIFTTGVVICAERKRSNGKK